MPRPTWRPFLIAAAAALALGGCGADQDASTAHATAAVPGTDYAASGVCELLSVSTVRGVLPGAQIDTSLPTPDSCFYAADAGDLILTAVDSGRAPDGPGPDELYDVALSDATDNGGKDVRPARRLGPDAQVAVNAADGEVTVVWRRGDQVYDLQYTGWDGHPKAATARAEELARAVQPLR